MREYVLFFGYITSWEAIETLIDAAKIVRKKLLGEFNLVVAGKSYHRSISVLDRINEYCKFIYLLCLYTIISVTLTQE